jgi:hypothetical protein
LKATDPAQIAVARPRFLCSTPGAQDALFVCFDEETFDICTNSLNAMNER